MSQKPQKYCNVVWKNYFVVFTASALLKIPPMMLCSNPMSHANRKYHAFTQGIRTIKALIEHKKRYY